MWLLCVNLELVQQAVDLEALTDRRVEPEREPRRVLGLGDVLVVVGIARNEGRAVEKEGKEILTAAAQHSPELKIAMETWKEIKFEFDTVDKLDIQNK